MPKLFHTYEVLVFLRDTVVSHSINDTKIKGMNPSSVTNRLRLMEHALYLWGTGISEGHSGNSFN